MNENDFRNSVSDGEFYVALSRFGLQSKNVIIAVYTYTVNPSAEATVSENTVTAPAGTYTVTAKLGSFFPEE